MSEGSRPSLDGDVQSAIPDVAKIPLEVLLDSDDSALSNSLRRFHENEKQGERYYAAHSTSV